MIAMVMAIGLPISALAQEATPESAEPAPEVKAKPARSYLVFVGRDQNAPYSFADLSGVASGFDVEVAEAVGQRIGRRIAIELLPADQVEQAVRNGDADGVIGRGFARGRDDIATDGPGWTYCGPTVTREYRIAVRKDMRWIQADSDRRVLDMLNGTRVAVRANDPVQMVLAGNRNVSLEIVDSATMGVRQALSKRVMAFVADQESLRYAARKVSTKDLRLVGETFYKIDRYGPAVPADDTSTLAADIRKALAAMEADGALAKMRAEWFDYRMSSKSYYWREIVMVAAAAVGAVIVILLVRTVRRSVRNNIRTQTRKLTAENELLRKQLASSQSKTPDPYDDDDEDDDEIVAEIPSMEEPRKPYGVMPTELNHLIRAFGKKLDEAVGKEIRIAYQLKEDTPAVLADADAVRQMLINLCTNARDAIERQTAENPDVPYRVWISTRLAVAGEMPANISRSKGVFVALGVRDAGCGIAPELVQKVFQPGYTTKPDAAGRGLSFVYETIAKHGGWIDVESAVGRGATFSIFLPAAKL